MARRRAPTNYGLAIGIIMLDSTMLRPPGDIGNASTFGFPVVYRRVKGIPPPDFLASTDMTYLPLVIEAARELEDEGVKALVGGCGFMSMYHEELVQAVDVPVFSSTLMFVPLIHRSLQRGQKVGILTANRDHLGDRHFKPVGWSRESLPVVIEGMLQESRVHQPGFEAEIAEMARRMTVANPEIGAFVLECTNLPPYAQAIQQAVRLPVFDAVVMTNLVFDIVVRRREGPLRIYTEGFM
jgi:Asp/Glu/hydantoin racemase